MSITAARSHVYAALAITTATGTGTWLQQYEQVLTRHTADILLVDEGEDGMDSGVGLEPISRKVLAVGIPQRDPGRDRAPGPPGATAYASEVSRALGSFGYVECHRQGEDRDPAQEIRRALTSDRADVLVVHIAGHGKLSPFGELHVIGSDGKLLDDPVSYWIKLVESHPDKPRPLTLFILDLCYTGTAAVLPPVSRDTHRAAPGLGDRGHWPERDSLRLPAEPGHCDSPQPLPFRRSAS